MIKHLLEMDRWLFSYLNSLHSTSWDQAMIILTGPTLWIAYLAVIVLWVGWRKGKWEALWVLGGVSLCVLLADQSSATFLKPWIGRLRPCWVPSLEETMNPVIHVIGCGGRYGFPSSHASDSFAFASFLSQSIRVRWFPYMFYGIAILYSYTRIYLGKHYPLDILGGLCLGMLIGYGVYEGYTYLRQRLDR